MAGIKTVDFYACFYKHTPSLLLNEEKATGIQSKECQWLRASISFYVRNECLSHTEQIVDIPIELLGTRFWV